VLGVSEDASTEEIKKAFKVLAKKCHPDLHPGDKAKEARFKEINEANSVLSDEKKRSDYDYAQKMGFDPSQGPYGPGGGFGGQGGGHRTGGMGGMGGMGGLEDLFGSFFEGRGAQQAPPRKGTDIESTLKIDFMHAALGSEFKITVTRGHTKEKLLVKIPPGVDEGSRVKLSGKGNPGVKGGPPGDLYIIPHIKPHPYFSRKGKSVYLDLPITIEEALLGASITVPTLTGTKKVKVPPGTQGGQKLRIKGEGIKVRGAKGDIYLKIKISVPKKIDKRSVRLIEEFSEINSYEPRSGLW
jgi:DnaJ-class molecular chaperone